MLTKRGYKLRVQPTCTCLDKTWNFSVVQMVAQTSSTNKQKDQFLFLKFRLANKYEDRTWSFSHVEMNCPIIAWSLSTASTWRRYMEVGITKGRLTLGVKFTQERIEGRDAIVIGSSCALVYIHVFKRSLNLIVVLYSTYIYNHDLILLVSWCWDRLSPICYWLI